MPLFNFMKAGMAEVLVFDNTSGRHELKEKHVTPGDVFEVSLDAVDALTTRGMGATPERMKFNEIKKAREQAKRDELRAEKHLRESNERIAALEEKVGT